MTEEEFVKIADDKAEELFYFACLPEEAERFSRIRETESLSIAEYVYKYRLEDFLAFLKKGES